VLAWVTLTQAVIAMAGDLSPMEGSFVAVGDKDIARAWLAQPTGRYPHGVFGDEVEAGTLVVETAAGAQHAYRLDDGSVFEDVSPRLADLDADGRDEVWTMRSDFFAGARLEAYGLQDGKLVRQFAADPIGLGFRWLNPIGVADFDGDGVREAAYVQTPHIGGIVTIVRASGERLVRVARLSGYSNHAMGSPALDLSTVADFNGDGSAEMIVPVDGRRQLAVLALKGGALVERWRSARVAPVAAALRAVRAKGLWQVEYKTASGAVVRVELPQF
jgi:hypothetical protein